MKTEIKKKGGTTVISVDGMVTYETQDLFQAELTKLIRAQKTDSVASKIIFDFQNLEFVGSSGISSFVQSLKDFNAHAVSRPVYCNVKSEFKRMIKAFDEEQVFNFDEDNGSPSDASH